MDKLCNETVDGQRVKNKERGVRAKLIKSIDAVRSGATDRQALLYDLAMFIVGFLLSRCHLIFGAYPLGLAFVSMLPSCVWPSLFGAAIGSLSLGIDGLIFAITTVIAVFLRVAISSGEENCQGRGGLFREKLLLRMSVGVICGFIAAVYEVLISGLNQTSLLFGLSMVITPPLLTLVFSGLFSADMSPRLVFEGDKDSLSIKGLGDGEKFSVVFFHLSALMLIFFIGLSFRGVNIFGISVCYVFSAFITLICAKRFGALRGMAVGFASSLGLSGSLSVSFALAGLASGAVFGLGSGYAVILGGAALCAWSSYIAGLNGLLSSVPEYVIAAAAVMPFLSKINRPTEEDSQNTIIAESAEDMVGTMALAYQSRCGRGLDSLEAGLREMSVILQDFGNLPERLSSEDYRGIVIGIAECHCVGCAGSGLCSSEGIRPCIKNADHIASLLTRGKKITAEDVNTDTEFCQMASAIAESINRESAMAEQELFRLRDRFGGGSEYELIAKMAEDSRLQDELERMVDDSLTIPLTEAIEKHGVKNGTIRAFGKRRRRFFLAGEDPTGETLTSPGLIEEIEGVAGVRLSAPQCFRKGKMTVAEYEVRRSYKAKYAVAGRAGNDNEASGDTVSVFEASNDMLYSIISDGMGSGKTARETSELVARFMKSASEIGCVKETALHILNRAIRTRREECSATVDLFELDMLTGNGAFTKSGAAPSFVKRDSSIFRIRSRTAPIGLMSSIDAERIKVEIKPGDHIIMLSDGIADDSDDAPWLLLLLGEPPKKDLDEYAKTILSEAVKNSKSKDDMTVCVLRIEDI